MITTLLQLIHQILIRFRDLVLFISHVILPHSVASVLLPKQDHFATHANTRFEGYYTRIQLHDGSTIIIILSSVPNSTSGTDHFAHFSLTRSRGGNSNGTLHRGSATIKEDSRLKSFRIDTHPESIIYQTIGRQLLDGRQAFQIEAEGFGVYTVGHKTQSYRLTIPDILDSDGQTNRILDISIDITNRKALDPTDILSTPHSPFVSLGNLLPLHWHIFSTHSEAQVEIKYSDSDHDVLLRADGVAHVEKNWGRGFPDSWVWMQAFSRSSQNGSASATSPQPSTSTIALAGGSIVGLTAFLAVYRSPSHGLNWNFGPPWTLLLGRSPSWGLFSCEKINGEDSAVELEFRTLTRRLVVKAKGPMDLEYWLPLDCPLFDGHGNVTARETFQAEITVEAYTRSPFSILTPWIKRNAWTRVATEEFRQAALEFGGDYRSARMFEADKQLEQLQGNGKVANGIHEVREKLE